MFYCKKLRELKTLNEFLDYFTNEYIVSIPTWYFDCVFGYPTTNNSLESPNNVIKNNYTLREKLSLELMINSFQQS